MGEARFKGDESIEMEFHVISRHFMEVSKTPGRKGRGGDYIVLCMQIPSRACSVKRILGSRERSALHLG